MKKLTLLLSIIFLSSCKGQNEKKFNIYDTVSSDYQIKIFDLKEKYDPSGKAKCSKYRTSWYSDTMVYFYGYSVGEMIGDYYGVTPNEVTIDPELDVYLEIQMVGSDLSKELADSLIHMGIKSSLRIDPIISQNEIEGYWLIVENQEKLDQFLSSSTKPKPFKYEDGKFYFESSPLLVVAKIISRYTQKKIAVEENQGGLYSFALAVNQNLRKQNNSLEKYGLILKEGKLISREIIIEKKE
ncbi:MAG: hypothetical protein LPK47_04885 [Bacteroidota bacterium]|nr:hypothetical protein [Bacteroidota bacterium]